MDVKISKNGTYRKTKLLHNDTHYDLAILIWKETKIISFKGLLNGIFDLFGYNNIDVVVFDIRVGEQKKQRNSCCSFTVTVILLPAFLHLIWGDLHCLQRLT